MGKAQTVIFDFDGTIADTFGITVGVFRRLARKRHQTDDAAVERLRGMPARQVMKTLGIHWWHLPYILYHGHKAIHEQVKTNQVRAFAGIEPVLKKLAADGGRLFIVSTNSNKNIDQFLRKNKLEHYFERTYGGSGLFDKASVLTRIARQNGVTPSECTYIGDEVRDVEATRKAGVRCIVVTWGYNNRQALQAARAETIVDTPQELLKVLGQPA